jgi:hypothetical protein
MAYSEVTAVTGNVIEDSDVNQLQDNVDSIRRETVTAKSANYTITDIDDIYTLLVTTGVSTITITLPTLADNQNRKIKIIKVDSGVGKITLDGEGAETINSVETIDFKYQYEGIEIIATSSEWSILNWIPTQGVISKLEEFSIADNTNIDGAVTIETYTASQKMLVRVNAKANFTNGQADGTGLRSVDLGIQVDATGKFQGSAALPNVAAGLEYQSVASGLIYIELLAGEQLKLNLNVSAASVAKIRNDYNNTGWTIEKMANIQDLS